MINPKFKFIEITFHRPWVSCFCTQYVVSKFSSVTVLLFCFGNTLSFTLVVLSIQVGEGCCVFSSIGITIDTYVFCESEIP